MSKLTDKDREKLSQSNFAFPKEDTVGKLL
jgi:hypothetical protein